MPTREEKIAARRAATNVEDPAVRVKVWDAIETHPDILSLAQRTGDVPQVAVMLAGLLEVTASEAKTSFLSWVAERQEAFLAANPDFLKPGLDRPLPGVAPHLRDGSDAPPIPTPLELIELQILEFIEENPELRKKVLDRVAERSREWFDDYVAANLVQPGQTNPATLVVLGEVPSPDTLFREWLRSSVGMDVTDHRLPSDTGRLCGVLEDNARKAFFAGMEAAR